MEFFGEFDEEFQLFIKSDQKQLPGFTINEHFQNEHIVLLSSVLQFFYKSICFSIILSDINSDVYNLRESIEKTREILGYHQENIQKKIQENLELLCNGSSAKEFLPLILEDLTTHKSVDRYTQIDSSVLVCTENKSKEIEKLAEINMIIAYCKLNNQKLNTRKEKLFDEDQEIMTQIERDLDYLEVFLKEAKLIESCFKKINSFESFKRYLTIEEIIKNKTSEFFSIKRMISELSQKNSFFFKYLNDFKHEDSVFDDLIKNHKLLQEEKILQGIYLQDLEKLKKMKLENNKELSKFTPFIVFRFFEENLELIYKNLSSVIREFNSITINYSKNFNQEIINLKFTKINKENFSALRPVNNKYKLDPIQGIINSNIEYLNKNLENLVDSINSLASDSAFNIRLKKAHLFPVHFPVFSLEHSQELNNIKEKILHLQFQIEKVSNKLNTFKIITETNIARFSYNAEQKVKTSQFNRSSGSIGIRGVTSVQLSKETYEMQEMEFDYKFLDNSQVKKLEETETEINKKILKIKEKLFYIEKISETISVLESELNSQVSINFPVYEIPDFEYQDLIKDWEVTSLMIEKRFIVPMFGIIFSRINFKKNFARVSSKPHKRTFISIKFFFEIFWESISDQQSANENNKTKILIKICELKGLNLGSLAYFLMSEEIVGSYLNSKDAPQVVINKKVEEDYDKSLFVICQNLSLLALKQSTNKDDITNTIRVIDEMAEFFWETIKMFKPKWEKELRASF